jgi:hypothetical protein
MAVKRIEKKSTTFTSPASLACAREVTKAKVTTACARELTKAKVTTACAREVTKARIN